MAITPEQCRAARGLLDWTQIKLAVAAGITPETVANFESGAHKPYAKNLAAIQAALEAGGVVFINGDDTMGPGLRLRAPSGK